MSSAEAAEWLAAQRPTEVDRQAVSSAQRCVPELRVRNESRFPEGGGYYTVLVVDRVGGTPEQRAEALAALQALMTPAPTPMVEAWLAELSLLVPPARVDDATAVAQLRAYVNRLADYPADVVREALLVRRWRWWPSWAELTDACDKLVRTRRLLVAEIERESWRSAFESARRAATEGAA